MSDAKYQRVPAAIGTAVAVSDEHANTPTKSVPSSSSAAASPSAPRSSSSSSIAASACRTLCKFLLLLTLSTMILAALLLGAAYHGGRHLVRIMGETVVPVITSDRPLYLPDPVRLSESEMRDVEGRLDEFQRALFRHDQQEGGDSGDALPPTPPLRDLVLTEREINGLICRDDGGGGDDRHHHGHRHGHHHHHHYGGGNESGMCGKVHVTLSEHEMTAAFSIPVEDYHAAWYGPSSSDRRRGLAGSAPSGRYFVGTQSLLVEPLPTTAGSSSSDADHQEGGESPSSAYSAYSVRGTVVAGHPDDGGNGNSEDFPLLDGTAKVKLLPPTPTPTPTPDDDDGGRAPLLDVRVISAQVFGWAATDAFVKRFFEGRNWAAGGGMMMDECPHAAGAAALRRIEGVEIADGKVVVRVRGSGTRSSSGDDAGGQQREDEADADATEVDGETRRLLLRTHN